MPVFDGTIKTPIPRPPQREAPYTNVYVAGDPHGTDPAQPDSGSLNWTYPPTDADLAGTSGSDCELIHGNVWQQVDGSLKTSISHDETHTVTGNKTERVQGIVNLTAVSGWQEEQQGPVNRHYAQKVTDTFDDDHDVHVPDSVAFNVTAYSNAFVGFTQIGICSGFFASISTALALTVANLDLEGKLFHAEEHPLHCAASIFDLNPAVSRAHIHALRNAVGMQAKMEASVNCLLDLDTATPFT